MNTYTKEVEAVLGTKFQSLQSPSLRLEKFLKLEKNGKKEEIEGVIEAYKRKPNLSRFSFSSIPDSTTMKLKLAGRLIINQAGGILENANLCLHRHFGYPYIPGSAVKGVARHAAWCAWKNAIDEDRVEEAKELAQKIAFTFGFPTGEKNLDKTLKNDFPELFGEKGKYASFAGTVSFLPAIPLEDAELVTDVLTPHGGNDYTNPVPNFFLAVEKDSTWQFTLAPRPRNVECNVFTVNSGSALSFAQEYLLKGLTANGVGAKKVAGYGSFVDIKAASNDFIELTLASPGFLGGASHDKKDDTDLRVSSLRGILRWWWKTLYRDILTHDDLDKLENLVWGSTAGSSMISLHLSTIQKKISLYDYKDRFYVKEDFARLHNIDTRKTGIFYLSYGMDEMNHDEKRQRYYVEPGAKWKLSIDTRNNQNKYIVFGKEVNADEIRKQALIALSLLCQFGGIGSKSRNGFGSLIWKDKIPLNECIEQAKIFCKKIGLFTFDNRRTEYSWSSALTAELTLPVVDPWTVIDRLGMGIQNFAASYKHCKDKAVLGLPRQIHGPKRDPMSHQSQSSHQRPEQLVPDLNEAQNGAKTRFASPVCYHIEPHEGKTLLRITAFPSGMIRNEEISKKLLMELKEHLVKTLPEKFTGQAISRSSPTRYSQAQHDKSINQVDGVKAGSKIKGILLEEKTKKGGWLAETDVFGKGSIQNTAEVPIDKKPGDTVDLMVAIAKAGAAQYKWIKA